MMPDVIVVDNFYTNPLEIRELALRTPFEMIGNFPGKRTLPIYCNDVTSVMISSIVGKKMLIFSGESNGAFQITTENDKSWIHCDEGAMWAGVLYLTPDPPENSGTVFYKHKASGATIYREGIGDID